MLARDDSQAHHRPRHVWAFGMLVAVLAVLLAGCNPSAPQSTISPQSEFARSIQDIYTLLFWLSVVVFLVVEGILVYSVIRFRQRPGQGLPAQIHGNTRLEIAWTIVPAVILVVIAVPTLQVIFASAAPPPADALKIRVIGHQWWWEVQYPDLGIVTANEIHMPVGKTVAFSLESADVIHSFWLPRLGGKQDVVPNHVNTLWFTPDKIDTYLGQCVEYCGTQHANMKVRGFVQSPADFDAWVKSQQARGPAPAPGSAEATGQAVFLRSACVGCHTVSGTPAQGKVGPDLSHIGSRTSIAAGMLDNVPENLSLWIRDPQLVKPGNKMATVPLSDADLQALVGYLESLK